MMKSSAKRPVLFLSSQCLNFVNLLPMVINWLYLKERCELAISEAERRGDYDTHLFFSILYNTGLRGDECLSTENWQLTQSNQIFVPPHKRGNAKLIDTILIPPVILHQNPGHGQLESFPADI